MKFKKRKGKEGEGCFKNYNLKVHTLISASDAVISRTDVPMATFSDKDTSYDWLKKIGGFSFLKTVTVTTALVLAVRGLGKPLSLTDTEI